MMLSEAARAWIYRVLLALQPIVVVYGVVSEQQAALWVAVGAAILGTGLATANTSVSKGTRVGVADEKENL